MTSFEKLHKRCLNLGAALEQMPVPDRALAELRQLQAELEALVAAERGRPEKKPLPEFLFELLRNSLRQNKIHAGTIAEIGGSKNSLLSRLRRFDVRFLSIFPSAEAQYIVADITNCPQVADNSFEAVFSTSVLEHVGRVHDAAREITRILKPGGITLHSVPFSYFFHGAPQDYWRMTTTALESLFEELETIDCFFYSENRRRNNLGSPTNRVDQDGGPQFAPDAFGGWRENWFTIYVGRKLPDGAARLHERRLKQVLVDLVKGLVERGSAEDEAIARALKLAHHISFNEHGRTQVAAAALARPPAGIDADGLRRIWNTRGKKTIRPSPARPNLMAMLAAAGLL